MLRPIWARSSVVERFTDNEEVDGSIPSAPTRMDYFLILYFFAGVVEDFLVTIDWRLIAEKKVISATIVSFVATLVGLFILYDILARLDTEEGRLAIFVYSPGIATGTFLGMKFKFRSERK